MQHVTVSGKFLRLIGKKYYVKGFSYGPFAPNGDGEPFPELPRLRDDFVHMRQLGANTVRVYFPPPLWVLDEAVECGLKVFIDVPWDKHRCFFEDWDTQSQARARVRETARTLGTHPGVFAISVCNEIPVDIVRFYGRHRVERFINQLINEVKQAAPECLATYVNFPTTEFLNPGLCDFLCFNVYLHDEAQLGLYLDRLQHIAGDKPLVLGEYGIDTLREGEGEQAALLTRHLHHVFRRGLAGSFLFAYTDDWHTGGYQIEDWAFGVTRRDRSEKPSASALRQIWEDVPGFEQADWPKVSVVVCSYNGASTLSDCLHSLMALDYPDYEVILIDDGSSDATERIAEAFPRVVYHRQENRGLSVARNVGAQLATGDIVAYTDSDCVADEHWLRYLVQGMDDQKVDAVGGPNISPRSDGWVAKCVASSPGNPSHVMLDDRLVEHIPGCNIAFRRLTLLGLGGFNPQFRQAGDDVDVCWRFLDAGLKIGYVPGAMVWHHRRNTVRAYLAQQRGYGRSEAMLHFKHPHRFSNLGKARWRGIIYGDGALGPPLIPETVYHGRFGSAPFQTIYRRNRFSRLAHATAIEWHFIAIFICALATLFPPLLFISLAMWTLTLGAACRFGRRAILPRQAPFWCRPLVMLLHVLQPIIRGWHRHTYLLRNTRLPPHAEIDLSHVKRISPSQRDLYWLSDSGLGREELLQHLVKEARRAGWSGDFHDAWSRSDAKLVGDPWHEVAIHTATEELGWPQRFTRARCSLSPTFFNQAAVAAILAWSAVALLSWQLWALAGGAIAASLALVSFVRSRRRCLGAITSLVAVAGRSAGLQPHETRAKRSRKQRMIFTEEVNDPVNAIQYKLSVSDR